MFCWCERAKSAAALALALILAGCGDPPRPFMPAASEAPNELLRLADPAGIAVDDIADLPEAAHRTFMAALVEELHKAEVPAYLGQGNARSFRLKGQVLEFGAGAGAGADVQIYWLLVDADGQSLGNHQVRRQVDAKAWKAGDPALIKQLAHESSQGIAKLMPDRREQVAQRGDRPVRLETNANRIVPPTGTGLGRQPAKGAQSAAQDKAPARPQSAQMPAAAAKPVPAAAAKPAEPLSVALRPVEGAPGDGAQALARAMRLFLGRASISVVEENQNPAAIVAGRVAVADLGAQHQEVKVDWQVFAPDGRRLGTIGQANRIPAGRLNGPWGGVANAVAENAVQGLSELFGQLAAAPPSGRTPSTAQAPTPTPK
ncbi:MAG: hypothetical protein ACT4N4_13300 [Rhodospirillales bacterium]